MFFIHTHEIVIVGSIDLDGAILEAQVWNARPATDFFFKLLLNRCL